MSTLRFALLGGLGLFLFSSTVACSADAGAVDAAESAVTEGEPTGIPGLPPPPPSCGGIAGLQCPAGMECKMEHDFPDAMGQCEPVPVWDRCNVDSDCIAVPAHGCCAVHLKEAVHKDHVAAYDASWNPFVCAAVACAPPHPGLTDTRHPLCVANRCAMVEPDEIVCGGHSPNPHACPDGFTCEGAGLPVDAPGRCVAE